MCIYIYIIRLGLYGATAFLISGLLSIGTMVGGILFHAESCGEMKLYTGPICGDGVVYFHHVALSQ